MKKTAISVCITVMILLGLSMGGCSVSPVKKSKAPESAAHSIPETRSSSIRADLTAAGSNDYSVNNLSYGTSAESAGTTSIAKRLCGKYSCRLNDEEYYTLEILEFADNIYAYMGISYADKSSGSLDPYTFWAAELIPDDKDATKNVISDSVQCHLLAFSIMANFGKYQAAPSKCILSLTENGVKFTGSGFTSSEETLLFEKDDRVSDAFIYADKNDAGTGNPSGKLIGLWKEKGSDTPLYIEFSQKGKIRLYKESPGTEVFFAGGEYHGIGDSKISSTYSILGCGDMPSEFEASYSFPSDNELVIDITDDSLMGDYDLTHLAMIKTEEKDVPVVTIDKVRKVLTDDYNYDAYALAPDYYYDGFYGVFAGAYEDLNDANELIEKINAQGFNASAVLSSEWENLNQKPYYCVTFDKCQTEIAAEGVLANAKTAGYKDAYIKFTGKRILHRIYYTVYSHDSMEIRNDKVILKDVHVSDLTGDYSGEMTLIADSATTFDPSCNMSFFGNYDTGDTVLEWFAKNDALAKNDYDTYSQHGPALIGVFDVSISGNHIDRYYGSYWWD